MIKKLVMTIFVAVLLSSCAGPRSRVDIEKVEPIVPVISKPLPPQTAGSLWTESRSGMFSDMKGQTVGDIITVLIVERASASKQATTSTGRNSSMTAGIDNIFGLEKYIGQIGNDAISNATLVKAATENSFAGSGTTGRQEDLTATLTTQIIQVLPNGNLRIEGTKTVTVNDEMQIVKLSGIIRPADVSPGNIVDSKNILNARIAYVGEGVISDKQQQGWLVRGLDAVWPF